VITLETRTLNHDFGGLRAVSELDLQVRAGELLGIIGPNGAGKTTVFNLITGVYRPTAGRIVWKGQDLVGLEPHQITARGIGRTFQNIRLFRELSVLDNVRIACFGKVSYGPLEALFGLKRFRQEERRIIEASRELLVRFGLESVMAERAGALSYGMQRRLEMARALATGPELLLLDEPAAGMNPAEIEDLMAFITWMRSAFKLTIVLIEHQMRLVMGICERLHVLDFGATLAEGTPQEVRRNPAVIKAYLGEDAA
jgi:branched-chain amino acid transport system ATP-binding protein